MLSVKHPIIANLVTVCFQCFLELLSTSHVDLCLVHIWELQLLSWGLPFSYFYYSHFVSFFVVFCFLLQLFSGSMLWLLLGQDLTEKMD